MKKRLILATVSLYSFAGLARPTIPVDVVVVCWKDNRCPHNPYTDDGKTLSLKWKEKDAQRVIAGMNASFNFKSKQQLANYSLRNFSMVVNKSLTDPVDEALMFEQGSAIAADKAVTVFIVHSLTRGGGIANLDPLTYGTKPILFVTPGNVGIPPEMATLLPVGSTELVKATPSMAVDPEATPVSLSPFIRNVGWFDMATSHEMMHINGMNHTGDSTLIDNEIFYDQTGLCGPTATTSYFERNQNDYPVVDLVANQNYCERNNFMHYGNAYNVWTEAEGYYVYDRCGKPSIFARSEATSAKIIMSCFGERFRQANQ